MLKGLKEDVEKVKKILCEQNGDIHKETENLKGNQKRKSGAKKHNNWNKKFPGGIQRQIWAGRKNNQWSWRQDDGNYGGWGTERKRLKKSKQSLKNLWDNNPKDQHTHCGSPRRRERCREDIRRNNGWKLCKLDEYKHSRSSRYSKYEEIKENYTKTYYNKLPQDIQKPKNLESSKRKANHHKKRISNKIFSRFPRNFGGPKTAGQYIQSAQRKKKKKLNHESYIWQKCPLKVREKSRHSQISKSWGSSWPLDLSCKKGPGETCQVKWKDTR